MLTRERDKLETALGGIKDMGGVPDLMFVIDTNKEAIAIKEAQAPQHPGGRDPRHQLRSGRHHLSDPGQRRRRPRDRALLRPRRPRGDRRHLARPGRAGRRSRRGGGAGRAEALPAKRRRGSPSGEPRRMSRAELRASVRAARRAGRSRQAHRRRPADREEAQRAGVFHYWQLAAMTPEDVAKLDADLKLNGRIARDEWVDQARA